LLSVCILIVCTAILPGAAGCTTTVQEKPVVNVVMAPYFGSWLCTYGIISGEIKSDYVDVVIDQSLAFDDQMLAGNYAIGAMNTAAFAISTEKGKIPLQAMGIYLAHTGLESTNGVAVVFVRQDSNLSSPADLPGKRGGVPGLSSGTASTFLGMLKAEYGIEEDEITIVDNGAPVLLELLRKGDIDAALVLGDPSVQAYYSDDFKILWNIDQAFEQEYGTYNPASFLTVQSEYLENNRETVKRVYDLLLESRQYGEQHLEELSQKYVAEFGGDAEFYQNAYRNHYSVTFDSVTGDLEESVMAIFGFVMDRGIINQLPDNDAIFVRW
jgi:ABC-type nitrate/sulfonate/bicarbonate transport system substrate-binding protein